MDVHTFLEEKLTIAKRKYMLAFWKEQFLAGLEQTKEQEETKKWRRHTTWEFQDIVDNLTTQKKPRVKNQNVNGSESDLHIEMADTYSVEESAVDTQSGWIGFVGSVQLLRLQA